MLSGEFCHIQLQPGLIEVPYGFRSGEEVFLCQVPLVLVVLVINHVVLHDLVVGVKQQVAGHTRHCVLNVVQFVKSKLEIVVHCRHKLFHNEAPDDWGQLALTLDLTVQDFSVMVCY
uniref:Uncharacterized protein n=1 Tax=Anguilla anguilla TaxID=7936 RepID=A0A0E9XBD7_ANGAN